MRLDFSHKLLSTYRILKRDGFKSLLNKVMLKYLPFEYYRVIKNIEYRIKDGKAYADPYKVIWIDPSDINFILIPGFFRESKHKIKIKDGKWDINIAPDDKYDFEDKSQRYLYKLDKYDLFNSIEERINSDKEWSNTRFYSRAKRRIQEGFFWHGCSTEEDLKLRCRKVDSLINHIKENGYKSQKQLGKNPTDEILVNIGQDGKIILDDGRHRFFIVKILKFDFIPVRVLVRHKKWFEVRKDIIEANDFTDLSDKTKKNIDHPDLQDIVVNN